MEVKETHAYIQQSFFGRMLQEPLDATNLCLKAEADTLVAELQSYGWQVEQQEETGVAGSSPFAPYIFEGTGMDGQPFVEPRRVYFVNVTLPSGAVYGNYAGAMIYLHQGLTTRGTWTWDAGHGTLVFAPAPAPPVTLNPNGGLPSGGGLFGTTPVPAAQTDSGKLDRILAGMNLILGKGLSLPPV